MYQFSSKNNVFFKPFKNRHHFSFAKIIPQRNIIDVTKLHSRRLQNSGGKQKQKNEIDELFVDNQFF